MKQIAKSCVLLLLVASACSALAADVEKQNLAKVREQIGLFESVLNQSLSQTFPGPFGYLDRARGAYLPGYGMVFAFEVNLSPVPPSLGPFGPDPAPRNEQKERAEQKKRREAALQMCERVLADFGPSLEVPANESVVIIVHGSAAGPRGIEKSTMLVHSQKRDIDDFRANKIDRAAFHQKVEVLEY